MDKKIKVAQIIGNVSEGGVEMMIINLYRNIDISKVEFHFFVCNTSVVINQEEIEKLGGKVIIVPSIKHLFKYKKALKTAFKKGNYDIVHANMNALSFIPLKVSKKCGIKIRIAHSHSTSNKKEHLRHLIKNILRPFSRRYATHFFACSEKAGRWLFGDKLFDKGQVNIIDNAINMDKFAFDSKKRSEIRKQLNIEEDINVVGHIGRFVPQKNHMYLVSIYEKLKALNSKAALLLVGSGDDFEKVQNYVKENNIEDVILTGPVENPYDYYQAMDCFCLPSLYEGLPVVGVEAQANGLKCFFSDEITKEAKLLEETEYLSIKESPDVWSDRINTYFINKSADRINNKIDSKYEIKNIASKVLSYYQTFIDSISQK